MADRRAGLTGPLSDHPAVDSGWHRGHKGAVEWAVKYWQAFGQAQVETSAFLPLPDGRMLVRYHARAQGKRSGATVEMTGYGVFTFREGRILRAAAFETRAEALAAVGSSEPSEAKDEHERIIDGA
jgi:hypothetical protein